MQRNRKVSLVHRDKKQTTNKQKTQAIETALEETQMLDSVDKDFKTAIINMFKRQKDIMSHQVGNISKGTKLFFKRTKWKFWR